MAWKPEREIEIIASTPPGGGTDRSARALLKAIAANRLLDVPARVVNIVGDGGRKAWMHIGGRNGDSNLLGINSPNNTTDVLTNLVKEEQIRSTPIAILYTEYIAFISRSDTPITSGADFLNCLAVTPSKLTISLSTSLGNPNHIAVAKVIKQAGAEVTAPTIRVFDSARDVVGDIVAGNADVGAITAASAAPELEAGLIRAIAVSSPQRLPGVFAACPTWLEQGIDCVLGAWRGVAGAADITIEQSEFWRGVLSAATHTKEWRSELERHLWTDMYLDGEALDRYLIKEHIEIKAMLGALGLLAQN